MERRLAAIVCADVAGYSRMMGVDEQGTHAAFKAHRSALYPIILNHGGRLVKNTGDGFLLEFASVVGAIESAIAIQTLHARHTFRSLLSREATYELLIGIWKLSHPSLKSSLNGVRLENAGTGDKTEKVDPGASDEVSEISEEDEE